MFDVHYFCCVDISNSALLHLEDEKSAKHGNELNAKHFASSRVKESNGKRSNFSGCARSPRGGGDYGQDWIRPKLMNDSAKRWGQIDL